MEQKKLIWITVAVLGAAALAVGGYFLYSWMMGGGEAKKGPAVVDTKKLAEEAWPMLADKDKALAKDKAEKIFKGLEGIMGVSGDDAVTATECKTAEDLAKLLKTQKTAWMLQEMVTMMKTLDGGKGARESDGKVATLTPDELKDVWFATADALKEFDDDNPGDVKDVKLDIIEMTGLMAHAFMSDMIASRNIAAGDDLELTVDEAKAALPFLKPEEIDKIAGEDKKLSVVEFFRLMKATAGKIASKFATKAEFTAAKWQEALLTAIFTFLDKDNDKKLSEAEIKALKGCEKVEGVDGKDLAAFIKTGKPILGALKLVKV